MSAMSQREFKRILYLPTAIKNARRKLAALRVRQSRLPYQIADAKARIIELEVEAERYGVSDLLDDAADRRKAGVV